ncbi:phage tail assembly chaperone G [Streptococcus dysgalactiae]|uniref:phage tail assembly chaperone G n=1 Tax=Streptococcus dysgalactiae TaxID=1334 RepID=UPI003A686DE0
MAILEIKIKNESGEKVVKECKNLTVRDYRDYLVLQQELSDSNAPEYEKLDRQLEFIVGLFDGLTVDMMYDKLNMYELNSILADVYVKLIGGEPDDPKDNA